MQRRDILRITAALAALPFARHALAQASAPQWTTAAAASLARQELYPTVLNSRIYVAGGLLNPNTGYSAHFESYDPAADRWTRLATLPAARHHIALATAGGLIYGVGGFSGGFPNWRAEASTYVYEPDADRWTDGVPLPYPSAEGVCAAIGSRVYLVGGRIREHDGARHFNAHADTTRGVVFDPAQGRWSAIAPAPTARNSAAAAVIDGRLYVVGGRQAIKQADGSLRQVNVPALEVYDPARDRWTSRAPMPQAQGGLAAAALDGRLYVFGGEQWVPEQKVFAEAWVYEPKRDSWAALPALPTPRHGLGAATLGNRIHVFGGGTRVGGDHASTAHEVLMIQG
ncbi:ring canal kelch-like protein [plant metagenome]|uniref:Ring canal kelch-like protein n=1 Tax=plant metagenome TaxID=1297885 RepID=A0A484SAN6_9ZZZZ